MNVDGNTAIARLRDFLSEWAPWATPPFLAWVWVELKEQIANILSRVLVRLFGVRRRSPYQNADAERMRHDLGEIQQKASEIAALKAEVEHYKRSDLQGWDVARYYEGDAQEVWMERMAERRMVDERLATSNLPAMQWAPASRPPKIKDAPRKKPDGSLRELGRDTP